MKRFLYALGLSIAFLSTAQASIDTYEFNSQAERERYRTLVEQLRCPKCQNQNIADSDAPISMDMRDEIYKQLKQGQSNEEIIGFLVDRYGDFVRYKPPVNKTTLLLWYGPATLLGLGFLAVAIIVIRRRRTVRAEQEKEQHLSGDDKDRLADILKKYK